MSDSEHAASVTQANEIPTSNPLLRISASCLPYLRHNYATLCLTWQVQTQNAPLPVGNGAFGAALKLLNYGAA
ncbi:hypothetical protein ERY430_80301 [Erythrobacter sp. EC-HK427]|nr:hypothetical protein ERY430_80301 [Erythrobacter sp. EC-HK427]